jgi:nicotinamidase-related amidase
VTRPARNPDLHGNAPDKVLLAVLVIDVINDLNFAGAIPLLRSALRMSTRLAALLSRARRLDIPVIYVNDNWGRWRSDARQIVRHCQAKGSRGRRLALTLAPTPRDYFVLKPKHSGFFATALDTLLTYLGTETIVLTGLTTDNCVLFTASDAYIRDFKLFVPEDCVASIRPRDSQWALTHMRRVLRADTRRAASIDLQDLRGQSAQH